MGTRLRTMALLLAVCGLIGAGCGSSSKSDAVSKCKDAAKKIDSDSARKSAEDACDALKNINTSAVTSAVNSSKTAAKQACESAANALPAGAARDNALQGCKNIK